MLLRFRKAEWDRVTEGNIFICARYFFVYKYTVSPAENIARDRFLKTLLWVFSLFKACLKLCTFLINVELTNLVLGGVRLFLSRIPYLRLREYDTKK